MQLKMSSMIKDQCLIGVAEESGQGREGSHHGVDEVVELKYVMIGGLAG